MAGPGPSARGMIFSRQDGAGRTISSGLHGTSIVDAIVITGRPAMHAVVHITRSVCSTVMPAKTLGVP